MLSMKMVHSTNGKVTRYKVEDNISSARMRGVPKNESEAELKKVLQEMRMNRTALQN